MLALRSMSRTVSPERCGGCGRVRVCGLGKWFLTEAGVRGVYVVRDAFKALKVHTLCTVGKPFQVGFSLEVNLSPYPKGWGPKPLLLGTAELADTWNRSEEKRERDLSLGSWGK